MSFPTMAEPVVEETLDTYLSFSSEFDFITILHPPSFDNFNNSSSDQALLGNSSSDLRFMIDDDGDRDFQLTLDSVEDLYFPSENESFVIPVDTTNREMSDDYTSTSGTSGDYVDKDVVKIISSYCNLESPRDSDFSGTAQSLSLSTQESANCVSEATNASTSLRSDKMVVDQKLKMEEEATTTSITKRKKDTIEESRNNKYRRLDQDGFTSGGGGEEDDEKRNVRLIRNRESAQLSRQRKKHYVEELEDKVKNMKSTITELNCKMSYFMAENATLRQQVGPGSGMCWPHHPPSYPAYMVKPQGYHQVPLLLIPRLKPKKSVAKVKKTRKVASVSVLGLLFCLFLFCVLAPIVNISYGQYNQSRGRALDVNSSNRAHCGRDSDQVVGRNVSAIENLVPPRNSSESLVASLFVPRNEKLVKIDGNLFIHSVASEAKNKEAERSVAKGVISPALPLPESTRTTDMSENLYSETQKALSSSDSDDTLKDHLISTTANGKMQQWFREGVAGPMFSSGMCTELFQFYVSSILGAIIPASPPTQQSKNTTDVDKGKKNRRILRDFNLTKYHNSSSKESFQDTKPAPSMVVSVFVDPREGGDGDINEMMGGTKSLSRVFVVVLVDGVKYVTYSCVLPQPEVPNLTKDFNRSSKKSQRSVLSHNSNLQ